MSVIVRLLLFLQSNSASVAATIMATTAMLVNSGAVGVEDGSELELEELDDDEEDELEDEEPEEVAVEDGVGVASAAKLAEMVVTEVMFRTV